MSSTGSVTRAMGAGANGSKTATNAAINVQRFGSET